MHHYWCMRYFIMDLQLPFLLASSMSTNGGWGWQKDDGYWCPITATDSFPLLANKDRMLISCSLLMQKFFTIRKERTFILQMLNETWYVWLASPSMLRIFIQCISLWKLYVTELLMDYQEVVLRKTYKKCSLVSIPTMLHFVIQNAFDYDSCTELLLASQKVVLRKM